MKIRILLILLLSVSLIGATKYRHVRCTDGYDSLRVYVREDFALSDSILYTAFPLHDSIAMDNTKDYEFEWLWYEETATSLSYTATDHYKLTGGTVTLNGNGTWRYIVSVVDTSGEDVLVPNTKICLRDADADTLSYVQWASAGIDTFMVEAGDWYVQASAVGHVFSEFTASVSADTQDTAAGYDFDPGQPGDADLCRVFGYARDIRDEPVKGAIVTARRRGGNAVSGSGVAVIVADGGVLSGKADSLGYWCVDLYRPAFYDDTTFGVYDFTGTHGGEVIFRVKGVTVPATGNFNLGDTLGAR